MPGPIRDYLESERECEDLLEWFHGLTELDRRVFGVLADADAKLTVDQVADEVGAERSTVHRSVQRLLAAAIVRREQVNYDQGGYYYVFEPADVDEVADELQRMLNDWYATMGQLIGEFREEYEDAAATSEN